MIHEIAKELDAKLKAKGVPVRVVTGPERTDGQAQRERIVLERDRDSGDSFGPVRSQHGNPKARMTRTVGCLMRIYAQSTSAGAAVYEHERRAETILDRIVCSLDDVIRGDRKSSWALRDGKFTSPTDLQQSQTWSGALYELRFSVDRSVFDRAWPTVADPQGAKRPEGGFDSVGNVLDVPLPAGGDELIPFGSGS